MGVVIVQSKPVAQVYRLFGALVALLLVMGVGFSIARWRAAQPVGSPYGGLAPVASNAPVPAIAVPAHLAALPTAAPTPAAPAAAQAIAAPAPVVAMTAAPAVSAPAPIATTSPAPADPARAQPRVIALTRATPGGAPLPAPAAAVAAATAAQAAPPAPKPVPAVVAEASAPAAAPVGAAAPAVVPAAPPAAGSLININTASVDALNHLPGVGRIGKTIARHRPYGSVQDLVDHRVLRAADFARIRGLITTN